MELKELLYSNNSIMQLIWGERNIEFPITPTEMTKNGVYVTPYFHQGTPVEINVKIQSGIQCNIFAIDPNTNSRVSWKNVEVESVVHNGELFYLVTSSNFNKFSTSDERRKKERIKIHSKGEVWDEINDTYVEVMIHDISDEGISFYAPPSFLPIGTSIRLSFSDTVNSQTFDIEIECRIVRSVNKMGNVFYGCQIIGSPREYLIYGCLKRLRIAADKNQAEKQPEENNQQDKVATSAE